MDAGETDSERSARVASNSLQPSGDHRPFASIRPLFLWVVCGTIAIAVVASCKDDVPAFFAKHLARRFDYAHRGHTEATDSFMPRRQPVLYDRKTGVWTVEEAGKNPIDLMSDGQIMIRWPPAIQIRPRTPRNPRIHFQLRRPTN